MAVKYRVARNLQLACHNTFYEQITAVVLKIFDRIGDEIEWRREKIFG
jgi:hypothetical protein